MPYDVIIIGGGVVGTAIARELSRYKVKCALIEKEEEFAFGVSKSNSGIIHPGTQNHPDSLKGRLCVQGNLMMRVIARELGVDFKEVGELIVAFREEGVAKLLAIKSDAEKLGVPHLEIVRREWLRQNEPNLNKEAIAALYAPSAGIISPYRLVYDLAENAMRNGVEVYTGQKVIGIDALGAAVKGANYFNVNTPRGIYKARFLINAAGLFADDISRMIGVDNFKIRPRKGEEFLLDKKRQYLANHLLFPLPEPNSKGILVIKTADGNPMIGPTAEEVDDKMDFSTSSEGLKKVLDATKRLIPSVDENDIIAYFAGLRPVAGDDFIIRHEASSPGFINVAGIQSPGLTASPAIARYVSDLLKKHGLSLRKKLFFKRRQREFSHLFSMPVSKRAAAIKKDQSMGDIVCRCELVSAKEVKDAIAHGATTLDGIKFRTRAQAGRCHGSFCTTRIMKILTESRQKKLTEVTKRGAGSEMVKSDRRK